MDSEEDIFSYSSGGGGGDEVDSEEEYLNWVEDAAEDGGRADNEPDSAAVKHYKILKEDDIKQLQENGISTVSSVLSVSRGVACTLLCLNNWNLNSVYDKWFADDKRNNEPIGILGKRKSQEQVCNICFEEIRFENMVSAACGHPFCVDCWKTYIATSINDGPGCLTLLCPEPGCKVTVGLELVDSLASADDKDMYNRYLYRSYVESSRNRKWCPAPGCNLAIEFHGGDCESYDVTCDCSYKFCWNCTEESHRPVDCKTVAKWIEKNSSEADNINYILAYTKPCPKCRRPIEKNQGCNLMTCGKPCEYRFCWVCLRPWNAHTSVILYLCNKFEGRGSIDPKSRKNAKKKLEEYVHYYERWDSNDKSRKMALIDLDRARNEYIDKLAEVQIEPHANHLQFVIEAWEQIVECRRILKWTYAYGYYLSSAKRNLFEFMQGEAEAALERLHHCAEKEMGKYLQSPCVDFKDFRVKLGHLTLVTRNYFENLVRALENKLSEVESCGTSTSTEFHDIDSTKSAEYQQLSKSFKRRQRRKRSKLRRIELTRTKWPVGRQHKNSFITGRSLEGKNMAKKHIKQGECHESRTFTVKAPPCLKCSGFRSSHREGLQGWN